MDLWIRTQDKKALIKVDTVCLQVSDSSDIYGVRNDGEWRLGAYTTKKRALEIIDEIQSQLFDLIVSDNLEWGETYEERINNRDSIRKFGVVMLNSKYSDKNNQPKIELRPKSAIVYEMPKD